MIGNRKLVMYGTAVESDLPPDNVCTYGTESDALAYLDEWADQDEPFILYKVELTPVARVTFGHTKVERL